MERLCYTKFKKMFSIIKSFYYVYNKKLQAGFCHAVQVYQGWYLDNFSLYLRLDKGLQQSLYCCVFLYLSDFLLL